MQMFNSLVHNVFKSKHHDPEKWWISDGLKRLEKYGIDNEIIHYCRLGIPENLRAKVYF